MSFPPEESVPVCAGEPSAASTPVPTFDIDGIELVREPAWNALLFDRPRPVLSSAPVGGGDVRARRIVNLWVDGPRARAQCDDPPGVFDRLGRERGWQGHTVGMMTGVAAARLGLARERVGDACWLVLATAGVRNAHRAGEEPVAGDGPGTINLVAATTAGLSAAARAEALMLATEAKCAALADHGIASANGRGIATGTGTDAAAIACADGADTPWTGHHTASGQCLARAVRAAIAHSLAGGLGPACGAA